MNPLSHVYDSDVAICCLIRETGSGSEKGEIVGNNIGSGFFLSSEAEKRDPLLSNRVEFYNYPHPISVREK